MAGAEQPDAILIPRVAATPSRLRCRFGWNARSTRTFEALDFEELHLTGNTDQDFSLPPLGPKALSVRRLGLFALGRVTGLYQFTNVEALHVEGIPQNGIELKEFTQLRVLSCEWHKSYSPQLEHLGNVRTFEARYFSEPSCELLAQMHQVEQLSVVQGSLQTLKGSEQLKHLRGLSLCYLRRFYDLETISSLSTLQDVWLENLPKAKGTLALESLRALRSIYIASAPIKVDLTALEALPDIETIWLAVPHEGLDWKALLSRPRLRYAGVFDNSPDEHLHGLAHQQNRTIEKIERAGTKRNPHVRITLRGK